MESYHFLTHSDMQELRQLSYCQAIPDSSSISAFVLPLFTTLPLGEAQSQSPLPKPLCPAFNHLRIFSHKILLILSQSNYRQQGVVEPCLTKS